MRRAIGSAVLGLLGAAAVSAASFGQALSSASPPVPAPPQEGSLHPAQPPSGPLTRKWVHLDGAADLERLRATNFNHYLRAQAILAAANEICLPGPSHPYPTRFSGDYPSCASMFWLTSNPPKKLLIFHLDDVGYLALVSVTVSSGKLQNLGAQAAAP